MKKKLFWIMGILTVLISHGIIVEAQMKMPTPAKGTLIPQPNPGKGMTGDDILRLIREGNQRRQMACNNAVAQLNAARTTQNNRNQTCENVERLRASRERNSDIAWALFDLAFDAHDQVSAACGDYVRAREDQFRDQSFEDSDAFWVAYDACQEFPSEHDLDNAVRVALDQACHSCPNGWNGRSQSDAAACSVARF